MGATESWTSPIGTSLDRVDNDKGYAPGNLRWATRGEQNSNKRKYKRWVYGDRIDPLLTARPDFCYETIRSFIKQGLTDAEILARKRTTSAARVYDIANCGPRHRFVANGKLVSNCNLQNLKRGGELRRSILAPKGHVIVVADSAQIEARVLAWLAGQLDIVNAFAMKEDVYKLMASAIYGVPVDQVTKDHRFIGKVCTLGLGFGLDT